jgi:hypothetical protein
MMHWYYSKLGDRKVSRHAQQLSTRKIDPF